VCTFGAVLVAMFFVHLLFFHGKQVHALAGADSVENPAEGMVQEKH
jgi:hypothetical protein